MKLSALFIAILVGLTCASAANAATIDLWSVFPDNQGDNGIYAYGYNVSTLSYRQLADVGLYSYGTPAANFGIPLLYKTASPWIILHPTNGEDAVLGWMVPESNIYDISGAVACIGGSYGSVNAYIKKNDTYITGYASLTGETSFDLNDLSLNAGDMLYFGINANGNQDFDTSRLRAQIQYTPVPEPASLSFLGLGLFGLLKFRKRKGVNR
ncbi:MAG: PEP-CTERM sorting domain-containing protein [Candidatus Omnitrophica bacterium]|nr:PEP-CTERM sorting domain-containing protein [Candidatus Omnitrophota bacterium]